MRLFLLFYVFFFSFPRAPRARVLVPPMRWTSGAMCMYCVFFCIHRDVCMCCTEEITPELIIDAHCRYTALAFAYIVYNVCIRSRRREDAKTRRRRREDEDGDGEARCAGMLLLCLLLATHVARRTSHVALFRTCMCTCACIVHTYTEYFVHVRLRLRYMRTENGHIRRVSYIHKHTHAHTHSHTRTAWCGRAVQWPAWKRLDFWHN